MAISDRELKRLEWSETRGCPFGEETWVEQVARTFDLETTMRPRERPRKFLAASNTA
jgi:putative transposase